MVETGAIRERINRIRTSRTASCPSGMKNYPWPDDRLLPDLPHHLVPGFAKVGNDALQGVSVHVLGEDQALVHLVFEQIQFGVAGRNLGDLIFLSRSSLSRQ